MGILRGAIWIHLQIYVLHDVPIHELSCFG